MCIYSCIPRIHIHTHGVSASCSGSCSRSCFFLHIKLRYIGSMNKTIQNTWSEAMVTHHHIRFGYQIRTNYANNSEINILVFFLVLINDEITYLTQKLVVPIWNLHSDPHNFQPRNWIVEMELNRFFFRKKNNSKNSKRLQLLIIIQEINDFLTFQCLLPVSGSINMRI